MEPRELVKSQSVELKHQHAEDGMSLVKHEQSNLGGERSSYTQGVGPPTDTRERHRRRRRSPLAWARMGGLSALTFAIPLVVVLACSLGIQWWNRSL